MSSYDLVVGILEQDALAIEESFNSIMMEKVFERLEEMRMKTSKKMFNYEEVDLDEAKKKLKKMCEEIIELSEQDIEEARRKFKKMCEELTEEEIDDLYEKKWIAGAIKHPGALHRQLHVPADKKIPVSKLEAAAEKGGTLAKRANLAMTLRKLRK